MRAAPSSQKERAPKLVTHSVCCHACLPEPPRCCIHVTPYDRTCNTTPRLQEFRRLESAVGAARDRAELLGAGGEGAPLLGVQVRRRTDEALACACACRAAVALHLRAVRCGSCSGGSVGRGGSSWGFELLVCQDTTGSALGNLHAGPPRALALAVPWHYKPSACFGLPPPQQITQVHNASGALLRERNQLQASAGYVDDMLAQAQSVTRSLLEQRRVFDTVQVGGCDCVRTCVCLCARVPPWRP